MLACWHGLAVMCMLGENDLKMSHWQLTCLFGQGPEKRTRRFHAGEYVTIFASSLDHILTGLGISLFLMHSPTAMLCHCALSLSHVSHSKSDCLLSIVSTCGPAAWTTDGPGTWEQLAVASTGGSSGSSLVRVTVPQSTATYSLTTGHSKMVIGWARAAGEKKEAVSLNPVLQRKISSLLLMRIKKPTNSGIKYFDRLQLLSH